MAGEIKDKEFLTFCNAANLDWQFVNYIKSTNSQTKLNTYFKLNEILNPDNFIRRDKDGNFKGYPYMPSVKTEGQVTEAQKKVGLNEMRKKAGVLMNYLEECGKNSGSGNFLKEWEVIYGADNYKLGEESVEADKKYIEAAVEEIDKALKEVGFLLKNLKLHTNLSLTLLLKLSLSYVKVKCGTVDENSFEDYLSDKEIDNFLRQYLKDLKNLLVSMITPLKSREKVEDNQFLYTVTDFGLSSINFTLSTLSFGVFTAGKISNFATIRSNNNYLKKIESLDKKLKSTYFKANHKGRIKKKLVNLKGKLEDVEEEKINEVFTSLLVQNVVGNLLGEATGKIDNFFLSTSLKMFISCFTRFSVLDVINTGIQSIGEKYLQILSKSINKSVYGSGNILIGTEMPLYDTGFRFLVLKKGNEIVVSIKGDSDRGDYIFPKATSRLKICADKILEIHKKNKGCSIKIIGDSNGGELAVLLNLIYSEIPTLKSKIAITGKENFQNLQAILDFNLKYFEDIGYMEKPMISITGDLAKVSAPIILGYLLSLTAPVKAISNALKANTIESLGKFWTVTGNSVTNVLKYLGISTVGIGEAVISGIAILMWVAAIAAVVSILYYIAKSLIDSNDAKNMYKKLKELSYITNEKIDKGIENYASGNLNKKRDLRISSFSMTKNIPLHGKLGFYLVNEKKYDPDKMVLMTKDGEIIKSRGKEVFYTYPKNKVLKSLPNILIIRVKETVTQTNHNDTIKDLYFKIQKGNDKLYYPMTSWEKTFESSDSTTTTETIGFRDYNNSKTSFIFAVLPLVKKMQDSLISNYETSLFYISGAGKIGGGKYGDILKFAKKNKMTLT